MIDTGSVVDPAVVSWTPAEISSFCEAAEDYPKEMRENERQKLIHQNHLMSSLCTSQFQLRPSPPRATAGHLHALSVPGVGH